jgi:hypothetical protein
MRRPSLLTFVPGAALLLALAACGPNATTGSGDGGTQGNNNNVVVHECPDGIDLDGDGYGEGCPDGPDCDDSNPYVNPGAPEMCNYQDDDCDGQVDEGALNGCGNCSPECLTEIVGVDPFPLGGGTDPNVSSDGVGLDPNGDVVLDQSSVSFNFMWIANTYDAASAGTVSKVDTRDRREVARYLSVTCFGNPGYQGGSCLDVAGNPIQTTSNVPSRTAVDFNFDVWVANRAFGGQPSATKIANSLSDCVDRNGNGQIDTSTDLDGDGRITLDCNGNGVPDSLADVAASPCTALPGPEYLGLDDECVLFTANYAAVNEYGRSVCLDAGDPYSGGAGNAWVGTNNASPNRFYKLHGQTGTILETVTLPAGIAPYGCAIDSAGILWTSSLDGRLSYLNTANTQQIGTVLLDPYGSSHGFYGIAMDSEDNVWMGGWDTYNTFRYRPDRSSFGALGSGAWTRIRTSEQGTIQHMRGIAADLRGWIWVASNNGYVVRLPQALGDGDHDWNAAAALGATLYGGTLGGSMIGVGIDFDGHVWGISYDQSKATRIDLDAAGNALDPVNQIYTVPVGQNPYTYSDFTGYGLRNFTRPRGTWRMLIEGCGDDKETTWLSVTWDATTPGGTAVKLRARSGPTAGALGDWFGYWEASPALLDQAPGPLQPQPARFIEIEFELTSEDHEATPVLHGFEVMRDCAGGGPQ